MEPNQTNPSPENSGIPQGIPTGVSVPNNQPSAQNTVQQPTAPTTIGEPAPAAPTAQTPVPAKEGPLDRFFKGFAKFMAKIMGQPDPITGVSNANSAAAKKTENIVGKVRNVANKAVAKASEAATKATTTINQATDKLQKVIPPPAAAPTETPPSVVPPVAPVEPPVPAVPLTPEQPK